MVAILYIAEFLSFLLSSIGVDLSRFPFCTSHAQRQALLVFLFVIINITIDAILVRSRYLFVSRIEVC